MVDAGSGLPPHWRGEGGDVNVATAEAMQGAPERFLMKRQQYFIYLLEDLLTQAFLRAVEIGAEPTIGETDYKKIFTVECADVSLRDNSLLAKAASDVAISFATLQNTLQGKSQVLQRMFTDFIFKFAGETIDDETLEKIISEVKANPALPVPIPGTRPGDQSS
jgi:hypothetical protein